MKDNLYTGLPVEGQLCARTFVRDLSENIRILEKCQLKLVKYGKKYNMVDKHIQKFSTELNAVKNRIEGKSRCTPIAVVIHGEPGVGKSKVLVEVEKVFASVKGQVFDERQVFSKVASSEYYEGYEPHSHNIIHISESGGLSVAQAQRRGDKTMDEFCSLVDSLPMPLNMAGVESKGKVYALPEMVITDTNNPNMNLKELYSNPAAHERRWIYIEVQVKPEYRKHNSPSLDPKKSFAAGGDMLDRWDFTVYRKIPESSKKSNKLVLGSGLDIYTLRSTLQELFTEHFETEEKPMI
jgi:hypothetical protein